MKNPIKDEPTSYKYVKSKLYAFKSLFGHEKRKKILSIYLVAPILRKKYT